MTTDERLARDGALAALYEPHFYFRDHDIPGWGVKRAHGENLASGDVIVTGLDKSVAAVIALLLNGHIDAARHLLGDIRNAH